MKRRSRGQATISLVITLPLFLAVGGLALDAGHVFAQRAHLQAIADAAARAGAIQVDEGCDRRLLSFSLSGNPGAGP